MALEVVGELSQSGYPQQRQLNKLISQFYPPDGTFHNFGAPKSGFYEVRDCRSMDLGDLRLRLFGGASDDYDPGADQPVYRVVHGLCVRYWPKPITSNFRS